MPPVVAVCPVHKEFASRTMKIRSASRVSFTKASEPCPKCGRISAVMEGTFDFDAAGIATILSGPKWSRKALKSVQSKLSTAGRALEDLSYSDDHAYKVLERQFTKMIDQNRQLSEEIAQLKDALGGIPQNKPSRRRLGNALIGIAACMGLLADAGGAIQFTEDVVTWVVERIEQGHEPTLPELESEFPTVEERPRFR